jgi:hypothetical protein
MLRGSDIESSIFFFFGYLETNPNYLRYSRRLERGWLFGRKVVS